MIKQVPLDVGTFFLQNTSFRTRLCFFSLCRIWYLYIHTVLIVHSIHFKKLNKLHTSFSKPKIQLTCFFQNLLFWITKYSIDVRIPCIFIAFSCKYFIYFIRCHVYTVFIPWYKCYFLHKSVLSLSKRENEWMIVCLLIAYIFLYKSFLYVYAIIMYSKETSYLVYDIEWYPVINVVSFSILIIRDNILNTLYFSPMNTKL